jgi:hypothetical protein
MVAKWQAFDTYNVPEILPPKSCIRSLRGFINRSNQSASGFMMSKIFPTLSIFCSLLLLVGCKQENSVQVEYVTGVITLDGVPISDATIRFRPSTPDAEHEGAFGSSNAHGVYELTSFNGLPDRGAMAGTYRVTVQKVNVIELMPLEEARSTHVETTRLENLLPLIYLDERRTPLEVTVNRGRNTINLELKSSP